MIVFVRPYGKAGIFNFNLVSSSKVSLFFTRYTIFSIILSEFILIRVRNPFIFFSGIPQKALFIASIHKVS